ncbi:MAG: hypothetical protein K2Y23_02355 [Cyanobacteria bacterium]|nr:hypothetical protein [Cyanobacteriota bacterium]
MIRLLMATLVMLFVTTDDRTPVAGFFDLPVTGGTATYDMLGLHPEERGQAISLLAREMFTQSAAAIERSNAVRNFIGQISVAGKEQEIAADTRPLTIAAPLTADHWRDAMELTGRADVFASLISNRSAILVCAGTMAADPSMRAFLERDRGLLKWVVKTTPAAFWIAARSFKVDKDRVIVPGGTAAEPIWEGLVEVKVTRPADFFRALLAKDSGRLAWFYDTMGSVSPERLAAAFGGGSIAVQVGRARLFYSAFRSADSNWKIEEHPFLRGTTDPWIVSTQLELIDGAVAPPADEWFWDALFDRSEITRRTATSVVRESASTPASLAWLVQKISESTAKERRDRFEMVRFAQGVFTSVEGDRAVDALIALGGYRRYRAALLTLDRMGITAPRVYARVIEAARHLDEELSGRDERNSVVAVQAAIAILERARLTEEIDTATAEKLLLSIADVIDPPGDAVSKTRPFAAITQWMLTTMLDALPPLVQPDEWTTPKTAYESRLLQALAGRPTDPSAPTLKWEGLEYRVDWFGGEHGRVKRIREQIESPGLDAAIAADDADKIADALLTLIYTPALGDPEGPALLGGDIAQRHNFGLVGPAGMRRDFVAWAVPKEQVGDGSPWHVEGSILGLDIALARLALRRIADNEMPVAPTINLNDQLTFARTVMTTNPRALRDQDRDRIVAAIARGVERLKAAGANLPAVTALAEEARLSPAVRQTLAWTVTRTPDAVPSLFGLRDVMWLGKPDLPRAALDRWGIYAETLESRLKTAMPPPAPWENFGGRADGGLVATQAPDLVLRMADETARLKLPAQLVPGLLMYAAQDYWHDVESRFPDDWPAMVRQALALSPSRVEDYVAALAGGGPLRPR